MKQICVFMMLLSFAFAKAQSLQNLVPEIEQRPRQITDTLDRDYDDRSLEAKQFSGNLKEKYSGADFDYEETTKDVDNIFSDFFDWLFGQLGSLFGIEVSPFWAIFIEWTIYALFAGIAVYFLVRLLANETASGIRARGKGADADSSNTPNCLGKKTKIFAKSCINHWDHKNPVENHCATNQYFFCFFLSIKRMDD